MLRSRGKETRGVRVWTVAELGDFYKIHRSSLLSHARRTLKNDAQAEEIVQEALVKVLLAAPELESEDHARAYLHRCVENLCMDVFRLEGRRPNLVLLDDAAGEVDGRWPVSGEHDEVVAKAEDAAVVRKALSLLSPAERAALVMWEMEGRSTQEIAKELGVKESSVRHTVSRARASMRRILSELIVDETRGLTALDLLSTSYHRVAKVAEKSGRVALSLVLVIFAFLGFHTLDLSANNPMVPISAKVTQLPSVVKLTSNLENKAPIKNSKGKTSGLSDSTKQKSSLTVSNVKSTEIKFPGLDKSGVPNGFTVSDSSGGVGSLYVSSRAAVLSDSDLTITQILKTSSGAANILLVQSLVSSPAGFTYNPTLSYGSANTWIPLNTKVSSVENSRLLSGNYLYSVVITVESAIESPIVVAASAGGRDLTSAPRQVITRLVLDSTKTQVLSQAVHVVEKGAR